VGFVPEQDDAADFGLASVVQTGSGINLSLGIVVDGIGGGRAGIAPGELVSKAVIQSIQTSKEDNIDVLLDKALTIAHTLLRRVVAQNVRLQELGAAVTVIAVDHSTGLLHIAHVGNTTAFLIRGNDIYPLTQKYADSSGQPTSFLGQRGPNPPIDNKLWLGFDDLDSEDELGGFPLQFGDVIFLCSDGILAPRRDGKGSFVSLTEIKKNIQRHYPEVAADNLVNLALSRQVEDHVSVALIEMPGKKIKKTIPRIPALVGIVLVVIATIFIYRFYFLRDNNETGLNTGNGSSVVENIVVPDITEGYIELLEGVFTVKIPGQAEITGKIGEKYPETSYLVAINRQNGKVSLGDGSTIDVVQNSGFYLTRVQMQGELGAGITTVTLDRGQVLIFSDSLMVKTTNGIYETVVINGIMGVSYNQAEDLFFVDCLEGSCSVNSTGESIQITSGQRIGFVKLIQTELEGAQYDGWLTLGGDRIPTPTPTNTPTNTPIPTSTPTPIPTRTPRPFTPRPTEAPTRERGKVNTPTPDSGGG